MKAVALAASLLATMVITAPASAVDNGRPDGDRHPNVGLLGFDGDGEGGEPPNFLCSGSVLSHRVFLTAAHCIDVFDDTVQWVAALEPGRPDRPVFEPGFVFDDFPFPVSVPVHRPIATVVHPRFQPDTLAHDVAVLVFAPRTFDVRPVELPHPRRSTGSSRGCTGWTSRWSATAPTRTTAATSRGTSSAGSVRRRPRPSVP